MRWRQEPGPLPWLPAGGPRALRALLGIAMTLVVAWTGLAIAYAPLPAAALRIAAAIGVALFATWAVWRSSRRWPVFVTALAVMAWAWTWAGIEPSHDRDWRPEVAVMPRVEIVGDRVRLHGYRDFAWRSREDFDVRYREREIALSDITGLDFHVSYWREGPVAHTFVSFDVAGEDPVAVSIETRPERGEGFEPVASLFKRFELIYVVGDERDLVQSRTNHRDEQLFLYRTGLSADAARNLFLVYARRINALAAQPEFYHLLSNSCTLNIVRYANRIGREGRLDLRHVLNGWSDRYLYDNGVIDNRLPFAELRARSRVNGAARGAAGAADFPERIRAGLPVPEGRPR